VTRRVFERDDLVATTVCYGNHEKAHVGRVLDIGRAGGRILVKFRDKPGQDWFAASKVKFVVGVDVNGTPVLSEERPEEAASAKPATEELAPTKPAIEKRRGIAPPPVAPPPVAPPPVAPPPVAPPGALSTLDALASAGVDPFEMWVALGRELTGREERAVAAAEAAVRSAEADIATAEAMLADARASAARARAALDVARERLAAVVSRTGTAR